MNILFIADLFQKDYAGGGELNNDECISLLEKRGNNTNIMYSKDVTPAHVKSKNTFYIIANFIQLNEKVKKLLQKKKYLILEHDHKYLKSRIPSLYKDFKAPPNQIINKDFYSNAQAVLCQSSFHRDIVYKNLEIDNLISLGGNLWNDYTLKYIEKLNTFYSKQKKIDRYSIMKSRTLHKNTQEAIQYCEKKHFDYELIPSCQYNMFLRKIAMNKHFIFFPKTPETLSRVVVEAKMMGVKVKTNKLVGASYEDWYSKDGKELIDIMRKKKAKILDVITNVITGAK